ncbi:MAG: NRDE family protein [Ferruginibacter sp.]
MCTVVFIPTKDKIYFGSLRDENPKRPNAYQPQLFSTKHFSYITPKDALANGTWVGVNNWGNVIVLLNGGFEQHLRKSHYRQSRGLFVTTLLASESPVLAWSLIDLNDIEPFTLVVWSDGNLFELVWDGNEKHRRRLDETQSHIWSSSTLYNAENKIIRKDAFQNWMFKHPPISKISLLNFFKSFTNKEHGFIMNRNEKIKTLSFTFIELNPHIEAIMSYYDFLTNSNSEQSLPLEMEKSECFISNVFSIKE